MAIARWVDMGLRVERWDKNRNHRLAAKLLESGQAILDGFSALDCDMLRNMSSTDTIDISHVKFSSTVFPTEEDMKVWDGLTDEEKVAVINRELAEAEASGIAKPETMAERIERVRKSMGA